MESPFTNLGNVIKGAAGVIAVVPGIALLTSAVSLPPTLKDLLGGIALALGVAIVLAIFLFGARVHKIAAAKVGVAVLAFGVTGVATAVFFFTFAGAHLLPVPVEIHRDQFVVIPLHVTGQLARDIAVYHGDYAEAIVNPIIGPRVLRNMEAQSGSAVWILSISLLFAQALLLTAIVSGAWKVSERFAPPQTPPT